MTIFGSNFYAGKDFNSAGRCKLHGLQRTLDPIVIGDGNHVQPGGMGGVFQHGRNCSRCIWTEDRVNVQIRESIMLLKKWNCLTICDDQTAF